MFKLIKRNLPFSLLGAIALFASASAWAQGSSLEEVSGSVENPLQQNECVLNWAKSPAVQSCTAQNDDIERVEDPVRGTLCRIQASCPKKKHCTILERFWDSCRTGDTTPVESLWEGPAKLAAVLHSCDGELHEGSCDRLCVVEVDNRFVLGPCD